MDPQYAVGFKDVYPWVWSVMLGVALTLAERRGAFQTGGAPSYRSFWVKNVAAGFTNLVLPSVVFALTMVRLGPRYGNTMGLPQILGCLYLAFVPLGTHHVWLMIARWRRWLVTDELTTQERDSVRIRPIGSVVYVILAFLVPTLAALFEWRVPW